jgi:hypothetical protein
MATVTFAEMIAEEKAAFVKGFMAALAVERKGDELEDHIDDDTEIIVESISMEAAQEARRSWNEIGTTSYDFGNVVTYKKAQARKGDTRATVSIIALNPHVVAYWIW